MYQAVPDPYCYMGTTVLKNAAASTAYLFEKSLNFSDYKIYFSDFYKAVCFV